MGHLPVVVGILLVVAACTVSAQPSADPCYLQSTSLAYWAGNISRLRECLDTIPFGSAMRTSTLEVIDRVFQAYSFSDLIQGSVAPYNLAVDWPGELDRIRNHAYTSDYDFHADLVALFNSIGDAHLVYYGPYAYYIMGVQSPFALEVRYVGGVQRYYAKDGIGSGVYTTFCACGVVLSDHYGKEVTMINGQAAGDFLMARARQAPFYVDDGVQLNNYLTMFGNLEHLQTMPLPTSDLLQFDFADASSVTVSWVSQVIEDTTSASQILSLNTLSRKKEADGYGQESIAMAEDLVSSRLSRAIALRRASRDPSMVQLSLSATQSLEEIEAMQQGSRQFGQRLSSEFSAHQASKRRSQPDQEASQFTLEAFLANNYVPLPHVRLQRLSKHLQTAFDLSMGVNRDAYRATTKSKIDAAVEAVEQETKEGGSEKRAIKSPAVAELREKKTGSTSDLHYYQDGLSAGYGSYNGTTVLRLYSFDNSGGAYAYGSIVTDSHSDRGVHGLDDNLIIDVTNNGGGIVCLNYGTLSFMVSPWRANIPYGPDVLYSPYDWRTGAINDFLYQAGNFPGTECVNPDTGLVYGTDVMTNQVSASYGGHSSSYTRKFNWDLCGHPPSTSLFFGLYSTTPVFNKIIVVTDGRCGSSCAYFIAQLRANNKVRIVSVGGDVSLPLATHSFAGGNVYAWSLIATYYTGYLGIHNLPTNAYTSYNFRENFALHSDIPRQFERLEADWHVPEWGTLSAVMSTSDADQRQALADVYATVQDLFLETPAGLPSIQNGAPPPPITPPSSESASVSTPTAVFAVFLLLLVACFSS